MTLEQERHAALLAAGASAPDQPIGDRSIGYFNRDTQTRCDSFDESLIAKKLLNEAQAVAAIVASQKTAGDPIDPNGARKLVRALIAIGLFKPA